MDVCEAAPRAVPALPRNPWARHGTSKIGAGLRPGSIATDAALRPIANIRDELLRQPVLQTMVLRVDLGAVTQLVEVDGECFETAFLIAGRLADDNFGDTAGGGCGGLGAKHMLCQNRIARVEPASAYLLGNVAEQLGGVAALYNHHRPLGDRGVTAP